MSLAKAAIELGRNKAIMDSYWAFHKGKQIWFFSPNLNLKGATKFMFDKCFYHSFF